MAKYISSDELHYVYSSLDLALANQFVGDNQSPLFCLVAAVSKALSLGHSFLPLAKLGQDLALAQQLLLPKKSAQAWIKLLENSSIPIANLQSSDDDEKITQALLVIDRECNLYFAKYFVYENQLAQNLCNRLDSPLALPIRSDKISAEQIAKRLAFYFPSQSQAVDYQALAVALALIKPFCVISGGPGTGKTTTVLKLLALLIETNHTDLRIALAAPTGKAAARLAESIKAGKQSLPLEAELKAQIPEQAQTIHRLIAAQQSSKSRQLAVDVLILDEASMLDLSLMRAVFAILPEHCKLILLGDKDQLPAVELGNLMADLCQPALLDGFSQHTWLELNDLLPGLKDLPALIEPEPKARLDVKRDERQMDLLSEQHNPFHLAKVLPRWADVCIELKVSYRFDANSGIGQLAKAVNEGLFVKALEVLDTATFDDVVLHSKPENTVCYSLIKHAADLYSHYLAAADTKQALIAFNQVQVLLAVRQGPHGLERVNQAIEQELAKRHLIQLTGRAYKGLVIMITQNNYTLGLFNGDIGLFDYDQQGVLQCFFEQADGSLRAVAEPLLPQFEPAYALTVHKSQGSEFDQVLLVLPDTPSPLLSREMLYTGITRAKKSLFLYANHNELEQACMHASQRYSALPQRLAELEP